MKRILITTFTLLPLSLLAQKKDNQKTYDEEFKKDFTSSCISSAMESGKITEQQAKEYCACSFEILSKKYTMDEVNTIMAGDAEEASATMLEVTKPCREELVRKLMKDK